VRLFVARATSAQPRFALTEGNALAVAQVCQRLDGMPLALELAAARVDGLTVHQIAGHLDQRFRLLTGGSRVALPRQQTLSAAIDWSYDLLSQTERRLLNRLSVFADGWTLEAAQAVCAGRLSPGNCTKVTVSATSAASAWALGPRTAITTGVRRLGPSSSRIALTISRTRASRSLVGTAVPVRGAGPRFLACRCRRPSRSDPR